MTEVVTSGGPVGLAVRSDDDLAELNRAFESAPPTEIIGWAVERFGPGLCLAASMNDAVLIDLAVRVKPSIEVLFIDTGYHFEETLETVETVRRHYGLNLRIITCSDGPVGLWRTDPDRCCLARKVEPFERALRGKAAWLSGARRVEAVSRTRLPIVAHDRRGLVKVNPIATWSDLDVARYITKNEVPVSPLVARGFASIGCWPCTRPIASGADPHSGRWVGFDKTECGLHQ